MNKRIGTLIILLALSTGCAAACGTSIPPGTVGILVDNMGNRGGKSMEVISGPNMVFVGAYHTLYDFPVSTQQYTWTTSPHEGSPGNEEFQFQTIDGSVVHADLGITFHIPVDKVELVFTTYRKDLNDIRNVYIRNSVREALNEVTSMLDVNEAIGPKKAYIIAEVQKRVHDRLLPGGIVIDSLSMVGAFRPPDAVVASLNAKLASVQLALQTQNEVQQTKAQALKDTAKAEGEAAAQIATAKGEAESRRLQAEAEAAANLIIARSLTSALVEYKRVDKWDGHLPYIQSGSGGGMILNVDGKREKQ